MTESTYEFSHAIKMLRNAIDYAQTDGDFQPALVWINDVEAAYKADIAAEQELTANANEGAKLLHLLATGGESRLDADLAAMLQWEDEKPVAKTINLNGYKATATASWRERHLNES